MVVNISVTSNFTCHHPTLTFFQTHSLPFIIVANVQRESASQYILWHYAFATDVCFMQHWQFSFISFQIMAPSPTVVQLDVLLNGLADIFVYLSRERRFTTAELEYLRTHLLPITNTNNEVKFCDFDKVNIFSTILLEKHLETNGTMHEGWPVLCLAIYSRNIRVEHTEGHQVLLGKGLGQKLNFHKRVYFKRLAILRRKVRRLEYRCRQWSKRVHVAVFRYKTWNLSDESSESSWKYDFT